MEKPDKILYKDQDEVWQEAEMFLKDMVADKPCVKEALVWASLAEGKFGLYEHEHAGREGSDIDLVIVVDEKEEIPEDWKFTGVEKSCFDLYRLGKFTYKGYEHEIDGLLVFPSRHSLDEVHEMVEGRSRSIFSRTEDSVLVKE